MHFNWYDIESHQIQLRGVDSSAVTLVAKSVLATDDTCSQPAAIGFTATIAIQHHQPLKLEIAGGFYGDLSTFRSELLAVRNGETTKAEFNMEGIALAVYSCKCGVRSGIIVEGECSSAPRADANPGMETDHGIGDFLLKWDEFHCYNLHFAFLTSQVDPPYLDNTIEEIDQLCDYIKTYRPTGN